MESDYSQLGFIFEIVSMTLSICPGDIESVKLGAKYRSRGSISLEAWMLGSILILLNSLDTED